jgi:hypothetical protein
MPEFLGSHGSQLAGAGVHGGVTVLAGEDAVRAVKEWSRDDQLVAPRRREFASVRGEARSNHLSDAAYDDELVPAHSASRTGLLAAANGQHADAVLVDGVLHGPAYVNGHANGHGTNGHSTNGHAVHGKHLNGHGRNGYAKHENDDLEVAEPATVLEASLARKPR